MEELLEEDEEEVWFGFGSVSVYFQSVGRGNSGLNVVWSRFGSVFSGLLVRVGLMVRVTGSGKWVKGFGLSGSGSGYGLKWRARLFSVGLKAFEPKPLI